VVERLVILSDSKITDQDVTNYANPGRAGSGKSMYEKFDRFQDFKDYAEKCFIEEKLKKNNWNIAKTASEIDIQRSHLYNKIEKFGLKREGME
jgi:two-component system, NtrC family, nitrogen regulation response regulator NtrX